MGVGWVVCGGRAGHNGTESNRSHVEPRRVSNQVPGVSVRQQISWVKRLAEVEKQRVKKVERTSFRRNKEEVKDDEDSWGKRRRRIGLDALPDGRYRADIPTEVLIDGYNVIGVWPKMSKLRDRGDLAGAREKLVDAVAEFAQARNWRCMIVFDAQGGHGERRYWIIRGLSVDDLILCLSPDSAIRVERQSLGVEVIYTGDRTADSFIERKALEICREAKSRVWVATSDYVQQLLAGAEGALVMSSRLFVQEMKKSKKETEEFMERDRHSLRGKLLIDNVNESTKESLYRLLEHLDK